MLFALVMAQRGAISDGILCRPRFRKRLASWMAKLEFPP